MRTLFETGFGNSRNPWVSAAPSGAFMGSASLGTPLSAAEIDSYTSKIQQGRAKLAQLRAWIAARIDSDPMLQKTINDPVVQKNFWDFMDIVNKDQYYVDQTWDMLQNPTSADYDIPEENLGRTDEWVTVINDLMYVPQNYGKTAIPGVTLAPGAIPGAVPGALPGARPGALPPKLTQPVQPMILGVPQQTFVIGAGVLGLGLLVAALA